MIQLTDDGTLDTVLRCSECGEEFRYNYEPDAFSDDGSTLAAEASYSAFIEWAIATAEHECTYESGVE
jgi:hypothetical protein